MENCLCGKEIWEAHKDKWYCPECHDKLADLEETLHQHLEYYEESEEHFDGEKFKTISGDETINLPGYNVREVQDCLFEFVGAEIDDSGYYWQVQDLGCNNFRFYVTDGC